jgi:hypothetical protein
MDYEDAIMQEHAADKADAFHLSECKSKIKTDQNVEMPLRGKS